MRFDCREASSEQSSSSHGYGSDESEDVSLFGNQQVRGETVMERFLRASEVVKIDLPEFRGRLQPKEFLEWLSAIEKFFEYKNIPENQQVKLVATRLNGYASIW